MGTHSSFIRVESITDEDQIEQYTDRLSRVDAELIILAKEQNANVILTRDRGLRRRATQEGVATLTLWHFLIEAKGAGIISEVKPLLDELIRKGILIREGVYQEILRQAGELEDAENA